MTRQTIGLTGIIRLVLALSLAFGLADVNVLAQRNRGNVRSSSRSNVHRNADINRNTNVNRNRNVNVNRNIYANRDVDVDINVNRRGGCCYYGGASGAGVAAAVATTAIVTAAIVGSRVNTLPPACSVVIVNGFAYQQCGAVWYQPQISGGTTTYVVINAPR